MQKNKIILLCVLLTACSVPDSTIQGEPTNIKLSGYTEMCEREPDSELCNEEES